MRRIWACIAAACCCLVIGLAVSSNTIATRIAGSAAPEIDLSAVLVDTANAPSPYFDASEEQDRVTGSD